jgi:hypothetical protein
MITFDEIRDAILGGIIEKYPQDQRGKVVPDYP